MCVRVFVSMCVSGGGGGGGGGGGVCVCVSACLSFYSHFRSSIIFGLTFQIADDLGSQLLLYLIYAMEKLMKICNKK